MYGGQKGLRPWYHWSLIDRVYHSPPKATSYFSRGLCGRRSYHEKRDYYEVLGVKRNATQEEIKAAFYTKSKQLHPDKSNNGKTGDSTADFVDLKEAYDVLRRPADRRAYDMQGFNDERLKYQDPYYYYRRRQRRPDDSFGFYGATAGTTGNMRDSESRRQSEDHWRFVMKVTAIGLLLVAAYNIIYVMQLRARERKLSQLIDEDEIAKSFMRQPELKDVLLDDLEMRELGRILKGDVDEAWRRKQETLAGKNPNEIREEYRWFRAVQDGESSRRIRQERAERRRRERMAARRGDPEDGNSS
uniref:J domain-containing protein n=1 Tax=Haemonchus contortus TaxID=6289 RepID=A0A7I4XT72_HAECO